MSVMSWKKEGSVAVITMENGENRHNPVFVKNFLSVLDEIEADKGVNAMLIASSDAKNWSQGIDINWILPALSGQRGDEVKSFLLDMNALFKKILQFPVPVIAVLNGHTFGNGAILACACDFRLMKSSRGYFCFPEVDINIPFLPGMLAIIKKAFPVAKMEEAIFTGKKMGAFELESANVIIKACEDDELLMVEAQDFAKSFAKDRTTFKTIKARYHREIISIIDNEDPNIIYDIESL